MLELALAGMEGMSVDDRELQRLGLSYTVDTLTELRLALGQDVSLVLLMGMDAYLTLPDWYRWRHLLTLTHIAVFQRPGFTLPASGPLVDLVQQSSLEAIHRVAAGNVLVLEQQQMNISATEIRQQLPSGCLSPYLAPAVQQYIVDNKLYHFEEHVVNDS